MKHILYILLILPFIGNAQIKLHGNAVERMTTDAWNYRVDSTGDTTYRYHPRYGQLYITANRMPSNITVTGTDVRFGTFSNDANSHYHVSCGASATNSFAYYTGGGTLTVPTATIGSTQFNISVWRGYDGSSWSNGGFNNVAAEATWTNTTGGHPIYEEFRATSRNTNTAQVRRYWSSLRNTYYFNPGTDGKFAHGLSQSIEPIGKAYFTGTVNDTTHIIQANSGQNVDISQVFLSTTKVFHVDKNGYTHNTKVYVSNPTAATDLDSIVFKQNGEYVAAPASDVLGDFIPYTDTLDRTITTKYALDSTVASITAGGGITNLNGLTGASQTFATGASGTDFGISSSGTTHTFNLPTASASNRGLLSTADWSTFNGKQAALGFTPENVANKATDFSVVNNTLYPTVQACSTYIAGLGYITGNQSITLSGDVTGSGTTSISTTIANGAVTLAKMADMSTASILGRNTAGTGAPEVLSASTVKTILSLNNVENTALSTWAGSTNITTVGTIGTGTWQGGIISPTYGGTGVNNGTKTITLSGNTTIGSSTHTVAFATSGNTSVTLPTSGTLVNTTGAGLPVEIGVAASDETTTITTGTAKVTFRMPHAMTVTAVRANINTVSTSGTPTIDINENGSSILGTKITIDANEKTSTTAATPPTITDSALADDAEITIDIDVAGTGAKGLKVWIIGTR